MIVRTAGPGPAGPAPQLIRTASGQMVMASVGQRIVQTGGQVLVARQPQQQPGAVLVQQQPVVRLTFSLLLTMIEILTFMPCIFNI